MRVYPCKKAITPQILKDSAKKIMGNYEESGEFIIIRYPPIDEIKIRIKGNKEIEVETKNGTDGDINLAIKKYNEFIEEVTGYSAKERKKLLMKG